MKKILVGIMLVISVQAIAAELSIDGYKVVNSQKDSSDITTDTFKNKDGDELTVTYTGELKENVRGIIDKLNSDFRSWTSLKIDTIKFSVINNEIQVLVAPKEYTVNNIDLLEYLSSGILFSYRTNLLYNFRIMVNNLFVPIKGVFIDEHSFNEKILSAVKDPESYISARDPEYLLEKIDKLYVEFERLRANAIAAENGNKPLEKEILDEVLRIKSENLGYTWKEVSNVFREKKVKISVGVIKAILRIYYNEY